jgi:hypothetical protein
MSKKRNHLGELAGGNAAANQPIATPKEALEGLECMVCLDLPLEGQVRQCPNGHLMCDACSKKVLAQANSPCPACRIALTPANLGRSLVAEHQLARAYLPCTQCQEVTQVARLQQHRNDECDERAVVCELALFGCKWTGVARERLHHNVACDVRNLSARQCAQIIKAGLQPLRAPAAADAAPFDPLHFSDVICTWSNPVSVTLSGANPPGSCGVSFNYREWTLIAKRTFQRQSMRPQIEVSLVTPSSHPRIAYDTDIQIMWSSSAPAVDDDRTMVPLKAPRLFLEQNLGVCIHKRTFDVSRVTCEFRIGRISPNQRVMSANKLAETLERTPVELAITPATLAPPLLPLLLVTAMPSRRRATRTRTRHSSRT